MPAVEVDQWSNGKQLGAPGPFFTYHSQLQNIVNVFPYDFVDLPSIEKSGPTSRYIDILAKSMPEERGKLTKARRADVPVVSSTQPPL